MINSFLTNNWRLTVVIGVLLFAWFLWPTVYTQPFAAANSKDSDIVLRMNRITGEVQRFWWKDGKWRAWNEETYKQTKELLRRIDPNFNPPS